MSLHLKYLTKTALYGLTPGGFGIARTLHRHKRAEFDLARQRHPVRALHNASRGWKEVGKQRQYASYDEYTTHQKQKFDEIIQMYGGFPGRVIARWRSRFYRRFRHLTSLLPADAVILCLGARQGTEVEVLRDIGFKNAYGIDLNPGPANPYVRSGDFMHLAETDHSIDLIYTNSLDHAFNLDQFLSEQVRVLKPNGYLLLDLPRYSGTRRPGAFEAIGWDSETDVINQIKPHFQSIERTQVEQKWHWVLLKNPSPVQSELGSNSFQIGF